MVKRTLMVLILAFAALDPAFAVEPDEVLDDPALEARARALSSELRCVVCQSESIDDSNAPLAKDLRLLVRERLRAGDSDAEVIAFIRARYGDYVLLKPPVQGNTLVLWLTPLALGMGAALILLFVVRARRQQGDLLASSVAKNIDQDQERP